MILNVWIPHWLGLMVDGKYLLTSMVHLVSVCSVVSVRQNFNYILKTVQGYTLHFGVNGLFHI